MVRRLMFRNARLAGWLADYAAKTQQNAFERGLMLYDKHRVWDYHASNQGLHASVEDIHSTFFQIDIYWNVEQSEATFPTNIGTMTAHCGCTSTAPFCEHITAAIIYWIMRLDKTNEVDKVESAIDQGDSPAYRNLIAALKKRAAKETPSYQRFDTSRLSMRPDLQNSAAEIVKTLMAQTAKKKE
ncbi:hypothetical protein NIE88_16055 [Sporolactobacillus shoreicorticis]|uniref:SWIM-type domain-containing protein n=1 Tax=Sporolactobacillus shoreicorticis TaxID=1923877 RepID=A0ABW5SAE0_9BACL|nr:hypothetical protein [Sporolactobacillus shoreicorticis]MCO7127283.1 hypothetical protein [Sporolactobacillus shoreicorticis]